MKSLLTTKQFQRDYKLSQRRGKNMNKLLAIVDFLLVDEPLPPRCRPHKLSGNYKNLWECHIEPDWLLIYGIGPVEISLIRTGTHSDLFE